VLQEVVCVQHDVSTLMQTNDELAERLAELEQIYVNAPVGLCLIDNELRYSRINRCLAEVNGLPVHEHIGRRIRDVVPQHSDIIEPLEWIGLLRQDFQHARGRGRCVGARPRSWRRPSRHQAV